MPKRIAYFTGTYPSLTETFVQREIQYLRAHDLEVVVCAIRRPHDLPASGTRMSLSERAVYARPDHVLSGIALQFLCLFSRPVRYGRCVALILRQLRYHPLPVLFRLFFHLFAAVVFCHHLKTKSIHHIHAHFATACTMALFCHYLDDISFTWTAHASGDIYAHPLMLSEKLACASLVIANSEYNRAYLNLVTDYQFEDKIEVVYNGWEVGERSHVGNTQHTRTKIVSVGGLKYFKGFASLISALALVRDAGYDFDCSIVGDGPQRSVLEMLISRTRLAERVTLRGSLEHPEVLSTIAQADIFVLASAIYVNGIRDGIPNVCAEAMALGVPVVSTFISGIPELIENGKSGILVPEKNPGQLAQAIMKLIDHPGFRHEIAMNGYNRVRQCFNVESTMARLFAIISEYMC